MDDSRQRKLGAILSYVSIIVTTLIQLVYTPFLIRKLGQSEYGLYSLVNSIIGYLTVLDLGFGNAIVVYTSKYRATNNKKAEQKLHGMFKIVFYIIGLIAMLLGIILFFNVGNMFGNTMNDVELHKAKIMMLILTFNLGISFSFSIYSSIINAYEKFVFQKIVAIVGTILKPLIMIPLLFLGRKSITMVSVITFINVITMFSNYLYCKKKLSIDVKYNGFDKILFKTILGYSIWIFLGIIVDKVNYSVDNFVLGAISGTIAVSIYSVATTFNTVFINLSSAISNLLLPKITKMVVNNATKEELTNEMIKIGRLQNYIIFLVCSGFILLGKNFISIWVGEGFSESYYVTLLLIVPACVPLIQNTGLSIMQAMNKYKFKTLSTFIMSIFNIIISIFLTKKYGATGAALGTCIALIICNILLINLYYAKKLKLNILKFWISIIRQITPFVIPISLTLVVMNTLKLNGVSAFIIYGSIYSILYIIVAYLLSMNKYEKNFIWKIFNKFKLCKENK